MLSPFRNLSHLRRPRQLDIVDFCETVFSELRENPSHDVGITEIRHFKEKDNMEHEFLLADIADTKGQKQCTLRLERSAAHQRSGFLERLRQVSTSVLPAQDTIWIASSDAQLTDGMSRGPSCPIARLPFLKKPFSLRELCLILSFFPAFSPEYKLREEQCYWFCNVVLSTSIVAYEGASIVEERDFKKAGRFGRFSVTLSATTRKLFIDAYTAIHTLGGSSGSNAPSPKLPPLEAMPTLVALLDVSSTEAKIRAAGTIARLAISSANHRIQLVNSQAIPKLASIAITFPMVPSMETIRVLVGELWPHCLESASVDVKIAYLALAFPDPNISAAEVQERIVRLLSLDTADCPASILLSSLDLSTCSIIQPAATSAIESHFHRIESAVTFNWIVTLSNAVSSPSYSPNVQRRIADFLPMVIRHRRPDRPTLLQANIKGMLTSESEDLKDLILGTLTRILPEATLEKHLLRTDCFSALEQLTLARREDPIPLRILSAVCQHIDGIQPYDPRLPMTLIEWLKRGNVEQRCSVLNIVTKFASLCSFSEDICDQGAPRVLAGIAGDISRRAVAAALCVLSQWKSCRIALRDAGLIPSGDDSHDDPISQDVITKHLRSRFPYWVLYSPVY